MDKKWLPVKGLTIKKSNEDFIEALSLDKEQIEHFGPIKKCESSKRYVVWIYLGQMSGWRHL